MNKKFHSKNEQQAKLFKKKNLIHRNKIVKRQRKVNLSNRERGKLEERKRRKIKRKFDRNYFTGGILLYRKMPPGAFCYGGQSTMRYLDTMRGLDAKRAFNPRATTTGRPEPELFPAPLLSAFIDIGRQKNQP